MFQSALAYLTTIDPGFPDRIQAASEADIQVLENVCGKKIPKSYRDFLASMGKNTGGLELFPDGKTDILSVLSFYRGEVPTGEIELSPDALIMGVEGDNVPMLWLKPVDSDDPQVLGASYAGPLGLYAESISNMVCQTAFYKYRIASYPHRVTLHKPGKIPSIMQKAKEIVAKAGFSSLPFSDAANGCFESQAAAVNISDLAYLRRYVTIGFKNEADAGGLIEKLTQEFQFKTLRH